MEAALRKSSDRGGVKEEKRSVESSGGDEEGFKEEIVFEVGNGRNHEDDNLKRLSPNQNGKQVPVTTTMERSYAEPNSRFSSLIQKEKDHQLESAKAEMGEVREENQKLKIYLSRIMKEYKTLQMQFYDIVGQEAPESISGTNTAHTTITDHHETEEPEFVSLSLGRTSSDLKKDTFEKPRKGKEDQHEGLTLGLQCKYEMSKSSGTSESSLKPVSPENSLEVKKEGGESTWPPPKSLKTMRSEDDEVSQQNSAKKARVSVRVRCDTPTMNDGCQWRKYGQKISKGNPCPRAYYRCTVAPSCPVRKQVQRCAEDMSILITTYEGTHNHPLPMSATAMASTTSAAASMLLSGSSTSGTAPTTFAGNTTTSSADQLRGLNFYLSADNSKAKHFYLPNSSISSSPSFPTITLDLTSTNSSSSHFNKTSSNYLSNTPRYSFPSTNLNFSSLESNPLPISWNNGVLNYGNTHQPYPYNKNQVGSLNFGLRQPHQENLYQSFMQKSANYPNTPQPQQTLPADSIAAATKAITSDPSFQSALAAALTSIIGSGGPSPAVSNFPTTAPNGNNKCSSSYLNRAPSVTNSQPASLVYMQPPLPFSSASKSKSTSPAGDRDNVSD